MRNDGRQEEGTDCHWHIYFLISFFSDFNVILLILFVYHHPEAFFQC